MKIEIDLTRVHRKEGFKIIAEAVAKGATVEDLEDLMHSLLFQKGKHAKNMRAILDEGCDYMLARRDVNRCYSNMDDANALIAHCQKIIAQKKKEQSANQKHFVDLVEIEINENTANEIISQIGKAVASGKLGEKELMQIIRDIKSQKCKLTMKDASFYDRMALAKKIVEFCEQQIERFQNPFSAGAIEECGAASAVKIKR